MASTTNGSIIDESYANAETLPMSRITTLDASHVASDDTRPNTAVASEEKKEKVEGPTREVGGKFDFFVVPIPPRLRYDSEKPAHFGLLLNAVFGFASTFIVANLYYCQPLLIQLAISFDVSYDEVSRVPTLVQAGYATGLLLISPLGDLVRRRPLLLLIIFLSTTLSIGLAITRSLEVFEALSFLVGAFSVAPQILIPLAADLAPPHRRASAISIVLAGLLLGILIARVIAGVIAEFVTWRIVYYMAIGVQALVLAMVWATLPDYPAKNKDLHYFSILWSMAKLAVTEPRLIQAGFISLASSACFANFWVTLTFLLGGPPYNYSTLVIGLFGLVGMLGVITSPFVGRLVDRLVPWYATLIATFACLVMQGINTGGAGLNVAVPVIVCFGLDVARQMQQVSLTTAVFAISESARSRLNAVLILSIFIGQVMGTAVGTKVFVENGWRAAAALSLGWTGFQLIMLFLRGPHVERYTWFGYEGGTEWRKKVVMEREKQKAAAEQKHNVVVDSEGSRESTEKESVTKEAKTEPSSMV